MQRKAWLISFHAFSNPVRFQTEGGSPQPGFTLGGQEAGDQHFFPGGGDWIWGEGGVNPLPQSILPREKSLSPTASVTETLQELPHCSSRSAVANLGIPKEPKSRHSRWVTYSTRVRKRGLWAGGPSETQKIRTRSQTWNQQPTNQSQLSSWHKMIYKSSWQGSHPRAILRQ